MPSIKSFILAGAAFISIGACTFSAIAAPSTTAAPKTAPAAVEQQPLSIPDRLKLTTDQRRKIAAIRDDKRKQIEAALPPSERPKFLEGLKAKKPMITVLRSLNLSPDKKKQIAGIITDQNEKIKAVLTADQLKQLQAILQQNKEKGYDANTR